MMNTTTFMSAVVTTMIAIAGHAVAEPSGNGVSHNTMSFNGFTGNGLNYNSVSLNGFGLNGVDINGLLPNGKTFNEITANGKSAEGQDKAPNDLNALLIKLGQRTLVS